MLDFMCRQLWWRLCNQLVPGLKPCAGPAHASWAAPHEFGPNTSVHPVSLAITWLSDLLSLTPKPALGHKSIVSVYINPVHAHTTTAELGQTQHARHALFKLQPCGRDEHHAPIITRLLSCTAFETSRALASERTAQLEERTSKPTVQQHVL